MSKELQFPGAWRLRRFAARLGLGGKDARRLARAERKGRWDDLDDYDLDTYDGPVYLVHSYGKVGSTTVFRSLRAIDAEPVYDIHFISKSGLDRSEAEHREVQQFPMHLRAGRILNEKVNSERQKVFAVTLVREPVARAVSDIFQNPSFYEGVRNDKGEWNKTRILENATQALDRQMNYVKMWFRDEIEEYYGIDCAEIPFDADRGWSIEKNDRVNLLVIRLEDLNREGPAALADWLGHKEPVPLVMANVRGQSQEAAVYAEVKNEFKIAEEKLREVYGDPLFRNFYGEKEIEERLIPRWKAD